MASSAPLLTIGIPTFNRIEVLAGLVARLLPCLGPDVELLVVDNCSTDGTDAFLKDLATHTPHVRASRNGANLGQDPNFLRVIEQARGEWVWLLGDDEAVDTALLPALLERLRGVNVGVVHLVPAWIAWDTSWRTDFRNEAELLAGFYDITLFEQLSCTVLRTSIARRHLAEAHGFCGHCHTFVVVSLRALRDAGAAVLHLPLLRAIGEVAAPRWDRFAGHFGAWHCMRSTVPRHLRGAVDHLQGRLRGKMLLRLCLVGLCSEQDSGLAIDRLRSLLAAAPGRMKPWVVGGLLTAWATGVPVLGGVVRRQLRRVLGLA